MKLREKVRFKARQYGYGYKNIKSISREIVKKVDELDKYLEKTVSESGKKRKKKK